MKNRHLIASLIEQYQYGIASLPFVLDYITAAFPQYEIKSVSPISFAIGSNNHNEGLSYEHELKNSLFFGDLKISINPNTDDLAFEEIRLRYRSHWNFRPYWKTITRKVEEENLINEATVTTELFDKIELTQVSSKYDLYVEFVGFKIDII